MSGVVVIRHQCYDSLIMFYANEELV